MVGMKLRNGSQNKLKDLKYMNIYLFPDILRAKIT